MQFCALEKIKQGALTEIKLRLQSEPCYSKNNFLLNLTAHTSLFLGYIYLTSFMENGDKHDYTCTKNSVDFCHQAREKLQRGCMNQKS